MTNSEWLKGIINDCDAVVVGAGAGLSAAAGLLYNGERFTENFADFIQKYHYDNMYSAAFQRYTSQEEHWAYWSRHIELNRYAFDPGEVFRTLLQLVGGRDYFVITTNVDHCFQKSGFDKKRLFYTQGDYGLWQCSRPCHSATYDNVETVREMVQAQKDMKIPSQLIPHCPRCGANMSMNLRSDATFVEDKGWHDAAARYEKFINEHRHGRVVYLELGVGYNTPSIIKYPFWQFVYQNKDATYISINKEKQPIPKEIESRSYVVADDVSNLFV